MAKPRNRYDGATGKPLACTIQVPPKLAAFLYRERIARRFNTETELVNHILRLWSDEQAPMKWPEVLELLKAEEREEGQGGATAAG